MRQALRRAGVAAADIDAFSSRALATEDAEEQRRLCIGWVRWSGADEL